jgi:hypothetical protein
LKAFLLARRRRLRAALPLAVAAALAATGGASGVVGGTATEIGQAPWHVAVVQLRGTQTVGICGGSIIDATRVVTAAHCLYGNFGTPVAPTSLSVRAGISDFRAPRATDAEQARAVARYRIHPGYEHRADQSFDDVAVIYLDVPLDLSGPNARAIPLPGGGATYLSGQAATLNGFGQQLAGTTPNGGLYRIDSNLEEQADCGTYNAVVLCAVSTTGSACNGDSGSGLVLAGVVIGVASTARSGCPAGGRVVYTSLASPEILRFVEGDDAPVAAPRRLQTADLRAPAALQVGQTVTCSPGIWTNNPTFGFRFLDAVTGRLLQQGLGESYVLKAADVGRSIRCAVTATTAGGVGTAVKTLDRTVAPPPTIAAAAATPVQPGKRAQVRVTLDGLDRVTGRAEVCVRPSLRVGARTCRTVTFSGAPRLVTAVAVPVKATAPVTTARVAVSAAFTDGRRLTTVGVLPIRR